MQTHRQQQIDRYKLAGVLLLAFVVRMGLAAVTDGYHYDTSCFFAWGLRMVDVGAGGFYVEGYFCDYPPAYMFVLQGVGQVMTWLEVNYTETLATLILVFVPVLADCAISYIIYRIAHGKWGARIALRFAIFMAFCPVALYDTAVWKQMDSVLCLLLLGSFLCLTKKRWCSAAALFGLGLAVKPQALLVGPVLALCYLLPLCFARDTKVRLRALKNGVLSALVACGTVYLCGLPFYGFGGTVSGLLDKYATTVDSYAYATINAFNFMSACGGNWVSYTQPFTLPLFGLSLAMPFTWQDFGTFAIAAITVFTVYLALKAHKRRCFSPVLFAGFYMIAIFTFAHCMHERYLLLGVVLLVAAAAARASTHLLILAGGFSITALLNLATVLSVLDTDDNFLTSATSTLMLKGVGLAETILCVLLFIEMWKICSGTPRPVLTLKEPVKTKEATKAQPRWQRKEALFVVVLTVCVSVLSFTNLGDTTAPQTPLIVASGETYTEIVLPEGEVAYFWYYTGVVQSDATLKLYSASSDTLILDLTLPVGGLFQWTEYALEGYTEGTAYRIEVSGAEIMEVGFRDADGNLLPVHCVTMSGQQATWQDAANTQSADGRDNGYAEEGQFSAMFDEQALIPDEISYMNSFYFDEIYHARTAYESIHGLTIYEITHPPLGKNFIALGILLFGMTGFGWRFSGAVFGVLMVPLLYCCVRRLTRKPKIAAFAAVLISLDFMRFAQSRIATIDTYAAFFILLSATCMIWYCQSVLEKGVRASLLPMALSGLAFGLGAASKWTGIYAGIGLAVLYFGVLYRRYVQYTAPEAPTPARTKTPPQKQKKKGSAHAASAPQAMMQAQAKTQVQSDALPVTKNLQSFEKEFYIAIGGGFLFFVFVPLCIYLLSYLPYTGANPDFGFADWWANQEYMYNYHSDLDATHPFSSVWYSWLFTLRPVWYYMGSHVESGLYSSIAGFFNPLIVWVGIAAWLRLCVRGLKGKGNAVASAIIIFFLSQLLPWTLVSRCTFLYHYYPCLAFLIIAIALWLNDIARKDAARARLFGVALLSGAAVFFVWFYPVLSGLSVGESWAQSLHLLPSFGFYIF